MFTTENKILYFLGMMHGCIADWSEVLRIAISNRFIIIQNDTKASTLKREKNPRTINPIR